jgi:flagella basal body P-ring formation protein FlgA
MPTSLSPFLRRFARRFVGLFGQEGRSLVFWAVVLTGALSADAAFAEDGTEASAETPGPSIHIELRPEVAVKPSSQVTLGDVASVSTRDPNALRRLTALELGQAPRAGDVVRLKRDDLMRWLRARTGIKATQIAWSGPTTSDIRLAVRDVTGETIVQHASEHLRAVLTRDGLRAEIAVSQLPRETKVPAGQIAFKVRPVQRDAVLAKRLSVWVEIWIDGRFVRTVPVDFDVSVFGPAYVATAEHPAGQRLTGSGLAMREVEWSGRTSLPVEINGLENLRLRRTLAPGDTVTRAHVETAQLVTRGDWATLRSSQGLVELESRVEVLQDGLLGQTVRVKLPSASSAILARVSGLRAVEVRE